MKEAETVRSEDFRGIRRLTHRLGDQLVAGVVHYAGGQPLPFGDKLRAWSYRPYGLSTRTQKEIDSESHASSTPDQAAL